MNPVLFPTISLLTLPQNRILTVYIKLRKKAFENNVKKREKMLVGIPRFFNFSHIILYFSRTNYISLQIFKCDQQNAFNFVRYRAENPQRAIENVIGKRKKIFVTLANQRILFVHNDFNPLSESKFVVFQALSIWTSTRIINVLIYNGLRV